VPTKVQPVSKNKIKVVVPIPGLKQLISGDPMKIPIRVDSGSRNLLIDTVYCALDKDIKIVDFLPKNFYQQAAIAFSGNNISASGNFTVKIYGYPATILNYNFGLINVQIPSFGDNVPSITVEVLSNGITIFHGTAYSRKPLRIIDVKAYNLDIQNYKKLTHSK
jgi:hypothetical protein